VIYKNGSDLKTSTFNTVKFDAETPFLISVYHVEQKIPAGKSPPIIS
jgi:hypothetical protein